jgi:hypothetical protein
MKDAIAPITKKCYTIKKIEQHGVEVDKATTDEEAEAVVLSKARLDAKSARAEAKKAQAEGEALEAAIDQAKKERCLLDRGKDTTVYAEVSKGTATHMLVGYVLAALLVVAMLAHVVLGGDGKVGVEVEVKYNASSTVGVSVTSTAGTSVVCGVEPLVVAIDPVTGSQSDLDWHTVTPSLFDFPATELQSPFAYRRTQCPWSMRMVQRATPLPFKFPVMAFECLAALLGLPQCSLLSLFAYRQQTCQQGPSFLPSPPGPHRLPAPGPPEKYSSSAFPFGMIAPVLCAAGPAERVVKGATVAHDGHRTLELTTSSLRPLHSSAQTYVEGAVQLWKAAPLVVSVDAGSGGDTPSIPSSSSTASTSLASSCKTIRYALEHGQIGARKMSSPLELAVSAGVYLGECSEDGNTISIPTAVKKAGGSTGAVKIDCEKKGKAFNVTQTPNSTFHLEGLAIANGKSAMGGAAFIEGGHTVLKECTFDDLESLVSSADGNFVGGGAIMFVVSRLLLNVVYPHSKLIKLITPRFLLLPRPRCNFIHRAAPSTTAALPPVAAVEYWSRSTQWAEDGRQPTRSPY